MKVSIKNKETSRIDAVYDRPVYFLNEYEDMKFRTEPISGAGQDDEAFTVFMKAEGKKERKVPSDTKLFWDTLESGKEISKTAYEKA